MTGAKAVSRPASRVATSANPSTGRLTPTSASRGTSRGDSAIDQRDAGDRDERAQAAAEHRQHEGLDDEVAREPRGARAEDHAHRQFSGTLVDRKGLQGRHVRARHEQDEADPSQQRQEHGTRGTEHDVREGSQHGRDPRGLVLLPVVGGRHGGHVTARLLERHSGPQPAEAGHPPDSGLLRELADPRHDRRPQLRSCRVGEALGHHADDGEGLVVENHGAPHATGVAAEASAPQRVAEHDDAARATPIVLGQQCATERGRDSQHAEEVPGHQASAHLDRLAAPRQDPALVGARQAREVLEHAVVRAPVPERRIGQLDEALPALPVVLPQEHQPAQGGRTAAAEGRRRGRR